MFKCDLCGRVVIFSSPHPTNYSDDIIINCCTKCDKRIWNLKLNGDDKSWRKSLKPKIKELTKKGEKRKKSRLTNIEKLKKNQLLENKKTKLKIINNLKKKRTEKLKKNLIKYTKKSQTAKKRANRCHICNKYVSKPFLCEKCNLQLCLHHRFFHKCIPTFEWIKNHPTNCAVCNKPYKELHSHPCKYCNKWFCEKHIQPELHNCKGSLNPHRYLRIEYSKRKGTQYIK